MSKPWAYFFGEGDITDKSLLGGKGCGLGVMTKIGLPVPQGFVISTPACIYHSTNKKNPPGLNKEVETLVARLEKISGKKFGKSADGNLLLLSIRSGAAISMPGMMDSILNLGLNDGNVDSFAKATGNERFAWDSYRRFIAMFGDVVMQVPHHQFESAIGKLKAKKGVTQDTDLTADDLKQLVKDFKAVVKASTGMEFPQDPWEQLWASITGVFDSWDNDRAVAYRVMNGIPHSMGTAVNVQQMVYGNMGDSSGTGVGFTRNPSTGVKEFYGEYLTNAQGEDVVAGLRTPEKIEAMKGHWPEIYKQLTDCFVTLEKHYKEMQDCEFTVENGKLFMLQTRKGKRTAKAAVNIAVDMYNEGLMTKEEAVLAVDPAAIDQLLHKQLDPAAKAKTPVLAKALAASPGGAVGTVVFSAAKAMEAKKAGRPNILVRLETSPEDIQGMASANGILTARGGMTSHAAVVARGMGKCCVSGCGELSFPSDEHGGDHLTECTLAGKTIKEGDWLTLDGSTGEVFLGQLPVVDAAIEGAYAKVMEWADEIREMEVRTNADTPKDAVKALEFGAQGIGLVRTEHMFFDANRISVIREMILAEDEKTRQNALDRLLPFQQADFEGLFEAMTGKPVIIRLLDPPLHEFLPHGDAEIGALAKQTTMDEAFIREKVVSMAEQNPMLGFRGCRLGVVNPAITEMQVKAIFQAALKIKAKGLVPLPEIEVPLVGNVNEYLPLKELILRVAKETGAEGKIHYTVGTMIEVPRAALTADQLAPHVDFMSFGTNDLTQMTCGFSRDDSGEFLKSYVLKGIYDRDPFVSIDQTGVGMLMQMCVAKSRALKGDLDIGICGEHGGEPASVEFCHRIGLSNVSCSPFRVPVARLAAAHARIKYGPQPKTLNLGDVVRSKL